VSGGNITTAGQVAATGNVSGGNINTAGAVVATGNVSGGNINTAGAVVATGNVSGGNLVTAGNVNGANVNATAGITAGTTVIATGNVSGGNITTAGQVAATGNVSGGNVITAGVVTATGNVTGGNITTAGNVDGANVNATAGITAGTTVVATGNVSGGNLTTAGNVDGANVNATAGITAGTTVIATGNVSGGNITTAGNVDGANINATTNVTATNVIASGNVDGGNVNTDSIVGTAITITATSVTMDLTGNLDMGGRYINAVADPVAAQDAATKQYVDDAVSSGIHIHTPVDVETPVALPAATYNQGGNLATVTDTIAGNTVVFSAAISPQVNDQLWFANSFEGIVANIAYFVVSAPNTSAAVLTTQYNGAPVANITSNTGLSQSVRVNSGYGANITANTNGALTVDGYSVSAGNRVLVYNQLNAIENGIYDVTDAGNVSAPWVLTRSDDGNSYIPDSSVGLDEGTYVFVKFGDTGAGESYVMTAPTGPFNIGQAAVTFTQFSSSQVYSANTQAGIDLTGTVFSAKVDNDTTAFDGGGNIKVKDGANLVTPNIGNATGNSLTLSGNGLLSATTVTATGNVSGGNLTTVGDVTTATVTASGNIVGANVNATSGITAGTTVTATGNVSGGNLTTAGVVTATGNVSGGNITTAGAVVATGNVTGGNISAGSGIISTTGNITGGNINATANVTGTGAVFSGNVTADTFIGNISGNIDAGGANTNIQFNDDDVLAGSAAFTFDKSSNAVVATGNITGGNLNTGAQVVATGNVTGGNLTTAGVVTATGNVSGGNITTAGQVAATGNVSGGNLVTAGDVTTATVTASGNVSGGNVVTTGTADLGNIRITGNDITNRASNVITINDAGSDIDVRIEGDSQPNLLVTDAGTDTVLIATGTPSTGATLKVGSTDSILIPVGNTVQRPAGVTGMIRFNTTLNALEYYDSDSWESAGTQFTIVTADAFTGDGSTLAFTLSQDSTTAATIVSINGVVQIPTTAYSVSGNVLTFTEAPLSSDEIDARLLVTTSTVTAIQNVSGNAIIEALDSADTIQVTGNLLPAANVTYNLGSDSVRWNDIYLANSTIYLGNAQISANATAVTILDPAGNATVLGGTSASISVSEIIKTGSNGVGNIGSSTSAFNTVFAKATSAQYADLAEMYEADADYEPGTVLCFGGAKEVTLCGQADSTRVAGVVSTNPSYLMNSGQTGDCVVAVALTGRVPCRVTGTVRKGDLMVSTGDGRARANNAAAVGTVIGKALADFDGADGVIEVVVGRV
jgi:hypothetical protein